MYKYENGILKIQKVEVPNLEVNIMNDIQESYRRYIEETIYDDMSFLSDDPCLPAVKSYFFIS